MEKEKTARLRQTLPEHVGWVGVVGEWWCGDVCVWFARFPGRGVNIRVPQWSQEFEQRRRSSQAPTLSLVVGAWLPQRVFSCMDTIM